MGRIYFSGQLQEGLDMALLRSYSQELRRGLSFREQNPQKQDDAALWELMDQLTRFSDVLAGAIGLQQLGALEDVLVSQGIVSPMLIAVYLFAAYKQTQNGKPVDKRIPKWIQETVERLIDGDTEYCADPGNDKGK